MARLGSFSPLKPHLLLSLPLCMLSSGLAAQTVLNATDLASLRTHIASANAGSGDFVINVAAGTYTLTGAAGDASPATGDLDIVKATGNLSIIGAATATTIIDANNVDRAFHINAGAGVTVTFQNLTIQNGKAVDNGSAATEARGGGIYMQSSTNLTLTNVTIKNCNATGANGANGGASAAGGAGAAARGGALYVTGGTVTITGCTLNTNKATGGNGGTGGNGQANAFVGTHTASSSVLALVSGGAGGSGGAAGPSQGGGIYLGGGNISISSTTISSSLAKGGIGGLGGIGGGATLGGSSLGTANGGHGGDGGSGGGANGAGIYFTTGSLAISSSTLSANVVTGGAGGLGGKGGNGTYNGTWIGAANGGGGGFGGAGGAARGGGIYCAAGTVSPVNSTLSANSGTAGAGGKGGNGGNGHNSGIFTTFCAGGNGGDGGNSGTPQGGGIYISGGTLTLNNSTNVLDTLAAGAGGAGGAVGTGAMATAVAGSAGIVSATQGGGVFVSGGTLNITSTIVANNSGPTSLNGIDIFGAVTANNSLIKQTTGATITGTGNVTGVDPALGALANNGGPTQTHAVPTTGSPALDAGANPGSLATDQRGTGFTRLVGAGVDIGAFENQTGGTGGAPPPPVVTNPATAITINANSYNIQGTAQANSLVRIYSDNNNDGIINGGDVVVATQQLTSGGTNFSVATSLTQNFANNFMATAFNGTLESSPADVPTITEDSVAPNMVVITSPASATSVMAANFTITGTAEANSLVRIYRDLNANGVLDSGEPVVGSQQLASGNVNFSISTPLIAASVNRFLATATDAASNESTPVTVPAITETSIAPTAPPTITTPASNITVNLPSFNIVGTAPANALVRIFRDNNNDGIVNGPDAIVGSQQLVSAGVDFTINVSITQNSANDFLATAEVSGLAESSVTNVPTITDNQGFSGSSGTKGGGGGGGCSTESTRGPWYALVAALGAVLLALRSVWTRREVP